MDAELPQDFLSNDPDDLEDVNGYYLEGDEEEGQGYEEFPNLGEEDPFQDIEGLGDVQENMEDYYGSSCSDSSVSSRSQSSEEDGEYEDETEMENGVEVNGHDMVDDMEITNGTEEHQEGNELEEGHQVEQNGGDECSISGESSSSSSSSQRRYVIKDVEYFAKQNLERYLKRRGFNVYEKPVTTIELNQLVENMKKTLKGKGHQQLNAVKFGVNYDGQNIVDEVQRFWEFYERMKEEDLTSSLQLKPMLIPMLIYFYYECVVSGVVEYAVKLFVSFSQKFCEESPSKENNAVLSLLANFSCATNFQNPTLPNHPFMKFLREMDLEFTLNPWVFNKIQTFVQASKLPVMANLFTHRFNITVLPEEDGTVEDLGASIEIMPEIVKPPDEFEEEEEVESEIHAVISDLRGSLLPNLPSILVYSANGRAVCGAVSKQGSMIAYGMDSGIRIFEAPLLQGGLRSFAKFPAEEIGTDHTVTLLNGHNGSVNDVAFHPKAKYLFSVGEDTMMRVWDAHNNICRAIYRGHHCPVWSLDISGSGNMLVTGSMDTTARIWVPERTDFVRLLVGHYFDVDCVKFHPNEAYVATGSVDKSVRLWSVADGNIVRMFTGSKGAVSSIAFHSDGKILAAAGEDDLIRMWDLGEGKIICQLQGAPECRDLCFQNDMLAASFADSTIRIWNTRDLLTSSIIIEPDSVQTCDSKLFDSKVDSVVKLYYKNPGKLYCLGCSSNAGTATAR